MISNILCKYAGWLFKRRKTEINKEKGEREACTCKREKEEEYVQGSEIAHAREKKIKNMCKGMR